MWIAIDKGDPACPDYKSRLVAKEINRQESEDMFAAAPPLEAKKALFSLAVSENTIKKRGVAKIMFIDVKRAYFHAKARRPVYIQLPPERARPGMCGRLNVSLYGTRDAAQNWEHEYREFLTALGATPGFASPCAFYHAGKEIRIVVHGDDFTVMGGGSRPQMGGRHDGNEI